jgi:hypothetical protein
MEKPETKDTNQSFCYVCHSAVCMCCCEKAAKRITLQRMEDELDGEPFQYCPFCGKAV